MYFLKNILTYMTISVNYNLYNENTMSQICYEKMIEDYNLRERERQNLILKSRLSRPCSRDEMFSRLAELANLRSDCGGSEILVTKHSAPSIMANNEVLL